MSTHENENLPKYDPKRALDEKWGPAVGFPLHIDEAKGVVVIQLTQDTQALDPDGRTISMVAGQHVEVPLASLNLSGMHKPTIDVNGVWAMQIRAKSAPLWIAEESLEDKNVWNVGRRVPHPDSDTVLTEVLCDVYPSGEGPDGKVLHTAEANAKLLADLLNKDGSR